MKKKIIAVIVLTSVLTGCKMDMFTTDVPSVSEETEQISHIEMLKSNDYNMALAVDLNGKGVKTIKYKDRERYFDFASDTFSQSTAWIDGKEGLLVMDNNGDGIITNGSEVFGSGMTGIDEDMLASLKQYDENGDGKISAEDTTFDKIGIWQDKNENAIFDKNESIMFLSDSDIDSISLELTKQYIKENNENEHIGKILLNKTDNKDISAEVILLKVDKLFTIEEKLPETEEIKDLPQFDCYGRMHSLRQAMLRNDELIDLVEDFEITGDKEERLEIFDNLVYTWTGVVDNPINGRGPYMEDGRKIDALEVFCNDRYVFIDENNVKCSNPCSKEDADRVLSTYNKTFRKMVYNEIMVQTHFIDVIYSVGSDGKDLTHTAELALEKADKMDEPQVLGEIYSTIKGVNEMDKNKPQMDLDSYIAYFEKERPEYVEMILSYE